MELHKRRGLNRPSSVVLCVAIAVVFCGLQAGATTLDLTTVGSSGYINGAYFQQIDPQSTGSGVINSIVRIQATGTEQGYNSDYRPMEFDEDNTSTFNRSVLMSAIPIVNLQGVDYREFFLDINENSPHSLLSLDKLEIYLLSAGNLTGYATFGTPVYTLDPGQEDNWIKLDYSLNAGSGSGDMLAYIPDAVFTGPNQYVYLFSRFGDNLVSDNGFEEWATIERPSDPVTPEPSSLLTLAFGLSAAGALLRRRAR